MFFRCSGSGELGGVPVWLAEVGGDLVELGDFGVGEQEAAGGVGALAEAELDLAGEYRAVIAVAEHVVDDGFEVVLLTAAVGEISTR